MVVSLRQLAGCCCGAVIVRDALSAVDKTSAAIRVECLVQDAIASGER